MFELYSTATNNKHNSDPSGADHHLYKVQLVTQLYERLHRRRKLADLWARLTHKSRALLPLADLENHCHVRARHSAPNVQEVPLKQIRGTEGRSGSFDSDFYPLQFHTADRWKSVALAWIDGATLPPVMLIQVGDTYYIRDGHHRVSVFKALGLDFVEAVVTQWEIDETSPCAPLARVPCLECAGAF